MVHSQMTTPDIETPNAQFHNPKHEHFESRQAFWHLFNRNNVFFSHGVEPEGSLRKTSCLGNTCRRLQWSKEQCMRTSGGGWKVLLLN